MTALMVVTLSFFLSIVLFSNLTFGEEISINCGQCHSTGAKPTNIPDIYKCSEGCHEPFEFLTQMHVIKADPLRASFFAPGSECLDCHKTWTCTNCHRPHNPPTGTDCVRCHTSNPSKFNHFGDSPDHPPEGIDCTSCHDTHLTEVRIISLAGLQDRIIDEKSVVQDTPSWMDENEEHNGFISEQNGINGNDFNGNGFNGNNLNGLEPLNGNNIEQTYDDPERPYFPDEDLPWYLEIYESVLIEPHEKLVEVGVSTMFSDLLGINITIILIAFLILGAVVLGSRTPREEN
jgi:hypothetical protein